MVDGSTILASLLLLTTVNGQIITCKDNVRWPATADARQNPPGDPAGYLEWWFFTAFSPASELGLALSYHPAHNGLSAMFYEHAATPSKALVTSFYRKFAYVNVSASNATMTFGDDGTTGVLVQDEKTYVLRGAIPDADLSWVLTYHQEVDASREHVDILSIIKLDWISYMPSATLTGEVVYKGKRYSFADGVGYHDHNSGKWPKIATRAPQPSRSPAMAPGGGAAAAAEEEVEMAEPSLPLLASSTSPSAASASPQASSQLDHLLSFDYKWGSLNGGASGIGAVYGAYLLPGPLSKLSVDYIFVRVPGAVPRRIEFGTLCGHAVHVTPLAFTDHPGGHREAVALRLTAKSSEYQLEWVHHVRSSGINGGGHGLGLVVFEQLSFHNLTVTATKDGAIVAQVANAPGFTEWSNPT